MTDDFIKGLSGIGAWLNPVDGRGSMVLFESTLQDMAISFESLTEGFRDAVRFEVPIPRRYALTLIRCSTRDELNEAVAWIIRDRKTYGQGDATHT